MRVLADMEALMGSQGKEKRSEGRGMKHDGLSFVFFRKLQSAECLPSSDSLALNDTFNNFSPGVAFDRLVGVR